MLACCVCTHCRFQLMQTTSFKELDPKWREALSWLHDDYFYRRQVRRGGALLASWCSLPRPGCPRRLRSPPLGWRPHLLHPPHSARLACPLSCPPASCARAVRPTHPELRAADALLRTGQPACARERVLRSVLCCAWRRRRRLHIWPQDECWRASALRKLPALQAASDMLVFGEDLGFVPACVPPVMQVSRCSRGRPPPLAVCLELELLSPALAVSRAIALAAPGSAGSEWHGRRKKRKQRVGPARAHQHQPRALAVRALVLVCCRQALRGCACVCVWGGGGFRICLDTSAGRRVCACVRERRSWACWACASSAWPARRGASSTRRRSTPTWWPSRPRATTCSRCAPGEREPRAALLRPRHCRLGAGGRIVRAPAGPGGASHPPLPLRWLVALSLRPCPCHQRPARDDGQRSPRSPALPSCTNRTRRARPGALSRAAGTRRTPSGASASSSRRWAALATRPPPAHPTLCAP